MLQQLPRPLLVAARRRLRQLGQGIHLEAVLVGGHDGCWRLGRGTKHRRICRRRRPPPRRSPRARRTSELAKGNERGEFVAHVETRARAQGRALKFGPHPTNTNKHSHMHVLFAPPH